MADDGMLLNFAVGDEPWQAKTTFKGGRWKDRLTAKKASLYGRNKDARPRSTDVDVAPETSANPNKTSLGTRPPRTAATDFDSAPRPAKRQRVDGGGDFRPANTASAGRSVARDAVQDSRPPLKQVISSLFTYNPASTTTKPDDDPQDEAPVEPSNAPLSSELDTFTSLGLSPRVAQHLLTKLKLKAPTSIQSKAVAQLVKEDSDAFLQAQTGSGKTLAYLLPIVQRLVNMSEDLRKSNGSGLTRDSGLFAIILAPTRELSKQISTVLESLLGCANWIVPGIVTGGESKKSEKARLRKGVNILVATPGRLADHFDHTEALDVSNVRWLVLDEGDRLMELGFEQEIQKIVSVLNLRMRKVQKTEIPGLPEKRTTVLCSATIKMDVQRLGSITLKDAVSISSEQPRESNGEDEKEAGYSAPAQLKQSYAVVPAKLRLVTLVAILRRAFARKGSVMRTMVFMSCADSVDFHFEILARSEKESPTDGSKETPEEPSPEAKPKTVKTSKDKNQPANKIKQGGTIEDTKTEGLSGAISGTDNPVKVFRLHGSLPQAVRTSTLKAFANSKEPSVLLCTDVAARGLDLPNVDFVIEYDPPFSKDDHLHRIGRTARAGRDGRALIFLQPGSEEGYVDILNEGRRDNGRGLTRHDAEELLKKGFGATSGTVSKADHGWEERTSDYQLDIERWALENPKHLEQARRAFQAHVRAYMTHVAAERKIFDKESLHLGHLAKAFALRDKPSNMKVPGLRPGAETAKQTKDSRRAKAKSDARSGGGKGKGDADDDDRPEATDETQAKWKMQRMSRAMGGASEFNLG
ncbi:hypothetical protein MBLNU459_g1871t1 [Dothideomycetes sp. NU459]